MENRLDLNIAYIGGGSRGWAWGLMRDLAMEEALCGVVRLYDIDMDAAKTNQVIGTRISENPAALSNWRYEASPALEKALTGADFVIISILPGTFDEMDSDVHWPEKYGIYQPVGDTVGPGGLIRAMRTLPMFKVIAEAVRDFAPEAWVINYTNPMSVCVRTLYEVFPAIKAFGCCHEVFGTQKLLAAMLEKEHGVQNVHRQDIHTNVLGINHFTWFDSASYQDMDLFPLYRDFADKYFETGFSEGKDDNWMNNHFACLHRVKFDLFRRYGLIAAAGDRHLAEFMPPWYIDSPDTAHAWGFTLTPVKWRREDLKNRLARARLLASGEETPDLSRETGEEGIALIKALLGFSELVSNVNIPNRGQIPNLPLGAVVETNALFRLDSIAPVMAGSIPGQLHSLIARHVDNQENAVKAALNCDYDLALCAFMNDPLVTLKPLEGQKLFDEMLRNTKKFLPKEWAL